MLSTSPASPSDEGTAVTLTATIMPSNAVGTVEFFADTHSIGTGTVALGVAHVSTSTLALGAHAVTATFTPTSTASFTGSDSNSVSFVVKLPPPGTTHTSLVVTPAGPVVLNTGVTLTATVDKAAAQGDVQFYDGATTLGAPVTISGGVATMTVSDLTVGSHRCRPRSRRHRPRTFLGRPRRRRRWWCSPHRRPRQPY